MPRTRSERTRKIALCGIMSALAVMLTSLESAAFGFLPSGIRIGLANIAVMAAAEFIGIPQAFIVTLIKSGFVLMTRGSTAGVLSLCGGLPSFALTAFMLKKTGASFVIISVASSVLHIAGQIAALAVIMESSSVFACLGLWGAASVISGVLTGGCMQVIYEPLVKTIRNKM